MSSFIRGQTWTPDSFGLSFYLVWRLLLIAQFHISPVSDYRMKFSIDHLTTSSFQVPNVCVRFLQIRWDVAILCSTSVTKLQRISVVADHLRSILRIWICVRHSSSWPPVTVCDLLDRSGIVAMAAALRNAVITMTLRLVHLTSQTTIQAWGKTVILQDVVKTLLGRFAYAA